MEKLKKILANLIDGNMHQCETNRLAYLGTNVMTEKILKIALPAENVV